MIKASKELCTECSGLKADSGLSLNAQPGSTDAANACLASAC
jgi:hypothetical protein